MQPLVYIIVLNWNRREDTLECLRSLSAVKYENFKILLVDNASSDGTVEAVAREFPAASIVSNSTNLRFAGGNNVGIRIAMERGADFVLLLNNDTTVDPDFLTELVAGASSDSTGMTGPKMYFYDDPKRLWYAGGKIEFWKGWISHIGVREVDAGQYDTPAETQYISGCCVLVKKEVVERIGMLDEAYYIYGEDADWCVRATRAGYVLRYVPAARIWHKLSVSSGGHFSWFKNWNKLKSQMRVMARYARWYHWFTIPEWTVLNAVGGFFRARKGMKE